MKYIHYRYGEWARLSPPLLNTPLNKYQGVYIHKNKNNIVMKQKIETGGYTYIGV